MGKKTLPLDDNLYQYLLSVSLRDDPVQSALRNETDQLEFARMQISADQAQFMAVMLRMLRAQRVIEIGTFTGYSAMVMAKALPKNGILIACDVSKEWTDVGRNYWRQAGVSAKIELRLAPALDTLEELIQNGETESFDFAFIDADKKNLINYYQKCYQLIRPGGVIAVDNTLWGGAVVDPADQSEDTVAIRELNEFIFKDNRVHVSLLPIGDGLTLALKK